LFRCLTFFEASSAADTHREGMVVYVGTVEPGEWYHALKSVRTEPNLFKKELDINQVRFMDQMTPSFGRGGKKRRE
jgi:hypothetical protein